MKTTCPLCERRFAPERRSWCACGCAMDPRCKDNHELWCPAHGTERWLGAVEI
ncbi:hypothetical protein [Halovivax sp.]|uniref:hypothetical protein n=1 Tax=Halovivax sp. TaxID=1935978 RepID=UPI0025C12917|nr:hypothetical protein [Halovivax sp.]